MTQRVGFAGAFTREEEDWVSRGRCHHRARSTEKYLADNDQRPAVVSASLFGHGAVRQRPPYLRVYSTVGLEADWLGSSRMDHQLRSVMVHIMGRWGPGHRSEK